MKLKILLTGGAGDDIISVTSAGQANSDTSDGGAGTDTLTLSSGTHTLTSENKIVNIEANDPIKNAQYVETGMPFSMVSVRLKNPIEINIAGVKFARVVPKPVKKLCIKKPNDN